MRQPKSKEKIRKDQILQVAARLFRKKGFSATSVRMIASEMNMEAASLYNHISSKQDILKELLLTLAREFMEGMETVEKSDANPFQKLEMLVSLHVKLTLAHPDQISLITGEWVHLEEPMLSQYVAHRSDYEKRFKSIISDGMKEGFIEKIDVDMAVFSILSSLHWLYSWSGRHRELAAEEIEKEIKQCLLYGLKKRESFS
jgi:AcrR family transcriptional regulator